MSRFAVLMAEMPALGERGTLALVQARRNSALVARVLSCEQFGFLVEQWNALDGFARRERAAYCRTRRHDWRKGPYGGEVCVRCMKTV